MNEMYTNDGGQFALLIMAATVIASVASFLSRQFFEFNILHPYSIARGRSIHTLITGNMIHGDIPHLLFNMMSYYFFAFPLERAIGSFEFCVVYFGAMLIGNLPSLVQQRNNPGYYTLGASGAVSGIVFAMILFDPLARYRMLFIPFPMPAFIFGIMYLAYSYFAARNANDNINHHAHLWGAIGGLIMLILVKPGILSSFILQLTGGI
ncbi:MAG: rhomboid family intramembrane serine protease [Candidatus Kapabacteria bacterium]|nr:rhomboid family intramembrane serine protease [Candidatus Kapabacteria bacterium]